MTARPIADLLADSPYPLAPQTATLIATRLRDYGVPWTEAAALVRRLPAQSEPKPQLREWSGTPKRPGDE